MPGWLGLEAELLKEKTVPLSDFDDFDSRMLFEGPGPGIRRGPGPQPQIHGQPQEGPTIGEFKFTDDDVVRLRTDSASYIAAAKSQQLLRRFRELSFTKNHEEG